MRVLATLQRQDPARKFGRILQAKGIEHRIENENNSAFVIWILDDDRMSEAQALLSKFQFNPDAPELNVPIEPIVLAPQQRARWQSVDVRTSWYRQRTEPKQITMALIVVSVLVSLFSITNREEMIHWLYFSDVRFAGDRVFYLPDFTNIQNGEVWRLVTPMFIHFGFLHLLFDMLWLKDLGSLFEDRKGKVYFLAFVLVSSALSNTGQFIMSGDPFFGGMSGVVYALLGFIWMKSRYDPESGFSIDRQTVTMMVVWYFLCLAGVIGNIANTAHTAGLLTGILWGILDSNPFKIYQRWQRKKEFQSKF